MATISQSAHNVERIVVSDQTKFESNGEDYVSRELIIKFADGTEAAISIYSLPVENITVEVQ